MKKKYLKFHTLFYLLILFGCSNELEGISSGEISICSYYYKTIPIKDISNFFWSKNEDKVYFMYTTSNKDATIDSNLYTFDLNKREFDNTHKLFLTKTIKKDDIYIEKLLPLNNPYFKIYLEDYSKLKYYSQFSNVTNVDLSNYITKEPIVPDLPKAMFYESISIDLKYTIYPTNLEKNIFFLKNLESKKVILLDISDLSNSKITHIYTVDFFPNNSNIVFLRTDKGYFYSSINLESGKLSNTNYIKNKNDIINIMNITKDNIIYLSKNALFKYNTIDKTEKIIDTLILNEEVTSKIKSSNFYISGSGKYIIFEKYETNYLKKILTIKNIETGEEIKSIDFSEMKKPENSIIIKAHAC